jgi:hypothetical protein
MSLREQEESKARKTKIVKRGSPAINNENPDRQKAQQLGFDKFFVLVNGWEMIIIAAVLSLFLSIPVLRYYSESTTLLIITLIDTILLVFPVLVYLYISSYYKSYIRLVNTEPYSISGWNHVIGSVSSDFWKGKNLAAITIEVKPGTSTPDEQKRLIEFCSAFANEGSKILSCVTQKHFTLELQFLVGKQSAFVIRKIFNELVVSMNRRQAMIEISLKGETQARHDGS